MNTLINFELARVLKEKGFNTSVEKYYHKQDPDGKSYVVSLKSGIKENRNFHSYAWRYSAPTISEVVMWLYEKHKIWICVSVEPESGIFYFSVDKDKGSIFYDKGGDYYLPTEAYEAGIEYTLKNLI